MANSERRDWTIDELRVLVSMYFNQSFSIGDDATDECKAIADAFGRTPSAVDRQWRNLDALCRGKTNFNIGKLVKQALDDYVNNPNGVKSVAIDVCVRNGWPLVELIEAKNPVMAVDAATSDELAEIRKDFFYLLDHLEFKVFSSGSQGFFCQGKIKTASGNRFQAQVTAVLIGSKEDLTIKVRTSREEAVAEINRSLEHLKPKTFKTGRTGYYGNNRFRVGDERFQLGMQAVYIAESSSK
jgi:hypothetical protein